MKSIYTKKALICVILIVIGVVGLFWFVLVQNRNLSPRDTVELYFTHFNEKSEKQIWPLVVDPHTTEALSIEHVEYVHLRACYEETPMMKEYAEKMQSQMHPEEKYLAKVYTWFDIKYAENAPNTGGFDDGVNSRIFYLTKESENGPWKILSYN